MTAARDDFVQTSRVVAREIRASFLGAIPDLSLEHLSGVGEVVAGDVFSRLVPPPVGGTPSSSLSNSWHGGGGGNRGSVSGGRNAMCLCHMLCDTCMYFTVFYFLLYERTCQTS